MSLLSPDTAKALFQSDHTCCMCRVRGKRVYTHPVEPGEGGAGQAPALAVLCSDCHKKGIDPVALRARHEEWVSLVACAQLQALHLRTPKPPSPAAVTTLAEVLRDSQQYELLALLYHDCGITELRDKYIEKALAQNKSIRATLALRALQGQLEQVDRSLIDQELERHQQNQDWIQLARLQAALKRWPEAVQSFCRGLVKAVEFGDTFSAASVLQEISGLELHKALLESMLRQAADCDDFWWEVRCLDAIGWRDELRDYVLNKQATAEESGDPFLQLTLARELGDEEQVLKIQKRILAESHTF